MTGSNDTLSRLETIVGRILRTGVAGSMAFLAAGLIAWAAGSGSAARVLNAGLIVLMAVPVSRIAASFVDAVRRRDRLLASATAIVLAVLALTIVYARAAQP